MLTAEESRTEELEFGELDDVETATLEDVEDPAARVFMLRLSRFAQEKAGMYGRPLHTTAEEIRHRKSISREVDRMIDGNSSSLELANGEEWRRLEAIAEKNLGKQKK